jgi:hypothetical protein
MATQRSRLSARVLVIPETKPSALPREGLHHHQIPSLGLREIIVPDSPNKTVTVNTRDSKMIDPRHNLMQITLNHVLYFREI